MRNTIEYIEEVKSLMESGFSLENAEELVEEDDEPPPVIHPNLVRMISKDFVVTKVWTEKFTSSSVEFIELTCTLCNGVTKTDKAKITGRFTTY